MKILLFTILISFNAFSIETKNCAKKIKLELSSFDINGTIPHDQYNERGAMEAANKLEKTKKLKLNFVKTNSYNSRCHYKADGASAVIEGSLRVNAKKKAVMKVYLHDHEVVAYLPLEETTPEYIVFKNEKTKFYYRGEYCAWGDCIPQYFNIGHAKTTLNTSSKCLKVAEDEFLDATPRYEHHSVALEGEIYSKNKEKYEYFGERFHFDYDKSFIIYHASNEYYSGYGAYVIIMDLQTCNLHELVNVYSE
jgi:hypothetical protein